jgi:hypothetical protein
MVKDGCYFGVLGRVIACICHLLRPTDHGIIYKLTTENWYDFQYLNMRSAFELKNSGNIYPRDFKDLTRVRCEVPCTVGISQRACINTKIRSHCGLPRHRPMQQAWIFLCGIFRDYIEYNGVAFGKQWIETHLEGITREVTEVMSW